MEQTKAWGTDSEKAITHKMPWLSLESVQTSDVLSDKPQPLLKVNLKISYFGARKMVQSSKGLLGKQGDKCSGSRDSHKCKVARAICHPGPQEAEPEGLQSKLVTLTQRIPWKNSQGRFSTLTISLYMNVHMYVHTHTHSPTCIQTCMHMERMRKSSNFGSHTAEQYALSFSVVSCQWHLQCVR